VTDETIEELKLSRDRTSRKSRERRLALKRLSRAHQRTVTLLHEAYSRESYLLALLEEEKQENTLLRKELDRAFAVKIKPKSWWPSFIRSDM
jgi:hypothetical protein